MSHTQKYKVGIISDTHGPICSRALSALKGSTHIIHAGDMESSRVIPTLEKIAPVTVILGNMDSRYQSTQIHKTALTQIGNICFYVVHDLEDLDLDPKTAGIHVVVHGHTHRPDVTWENDILYVNPGSPSRPRGSTPPSIATVEIVESKINVQIIDLTNDI